MPYSWPISRSASATRDLCSSRKGDQALNEEIRLAPVGTPVLGPAGVVGGRRGLRNSFGPALAGVGCMQTGLCRMRTESLAGSSPRTGKRISDVRDEGTQSASGRSSFRAETANGPLHPPQTAENRGCSAKRGNSGLAQDCVVGLGDGVSGLVAAVSGPLGDCASD